MSNSDPVCARRREERGPVPGREQASAEAEALSACRLSDAELDLVPGGRSDEAGAEAIKRHWPVF